PPAHAESKTLNERATKYIAFINASFSKSEVVVSPHSSFLPHRFNTAFSLDTRPSTLFARAYRLWEITCVKPATETVGVRISSLSVLLPPEPSTAKSTASATKSAKTPTPQPAHDTAN